jgi:hypothetical protein
MKAFLVFFVLPAISIAQLVLNPQPLPPVNCPVCVYEPSPQFVHVTSLGSPKFCSCSGSNPIKVIMSFESGQSIPPRYCCTNTCPIYPMYTFNTNCNKCPPFPGIIMSEIIDPCHKSIRGSRCCFPY